MTDVTPELLEKIQKSFDNKVAADKAIEAFKKKLKAGKANQRDVTLYNRTISGHASEALIENLTDENLPDGTLYYNIAKRTVTPTIENVHDLTVDAEIELTKQTYKKQNIGITPKRTKLNAERVNSFVNKLVLVSALGETEKEKYTQLLTGPLQNLCESSVNDYIDEQVNFNERAGMKAKITRYTLGKCCDWCESLAGTYDAANAPKEIYAKHDGCNCFTVYETEKTFTDVWSKKTFASEREARIERERELIKESEATDAARAEKLQKLLEEDLRG